MLLGDKVVIVSGVGPGLGREIAAAAVREGASVMMGARTEANLEAAAKEIDPSGTTVGYQVTDISDPAQADLAEAQADPSAQPERVASLEQGVDDAQAGVDAATAWNDEAQGLSDGAILFRLNCARCHTKGWSYTVTDPARADLPPLAAPGSGAYGPNLTGGSVLLQFPGEAGRQGQFDWVALGIPKNNEYGVRGISSGRMPHFGRVLSEEQIDAIVDYERSL